ncbi:hypothetical protein WICMUC_002174 [Wickerhamomyces mucosus]|uniref:Cytoplasmic tRNA 2-thiolation protein 2 n=1 Tax=Wickerhamomyces mucosus TaxID=1378264 RepID=A0A9P8PR99_9ASCO|nr:hypothetical protein WICMUC_002174 [Wickerhamomyces mucosus]
MSDVQICSRCKAQESVTVSRKEAFCKPCFIRFVSGKQRKQMSSDKFKLKFGDNFEVERVLFPISFGSSSIVLLDILISLINEQLTNPRAKLGFDLNILFIDDTKIERYENELSTLISNLKSHYRTEDLPIKFTILDINSFVSNKKLLNKILINPEYESFRLNEKTEKYEVKELLNACANRASKHDLLQLITKSLILDFARANNLSTILWGHNMTTLAEEVISLTVKGRGSEIYARLTDGEVDLDEGYKVENIHPLRDISKNEIITFIELQDLSKFTLLPAIRPINLMNKQKTINEVVSGYYEVVDHEYDNIVSTVVKTGTKLAEPVKKFHGNHCSICSSKIYNEPKDWLRDITYTSNKGPQNEIELELFNDWKELNQNLLKELDNPNNKPIDMCYGCIVTISSSNKAALKWPILEERKSKDDILAEFIIDDEED